MPTRFQDKHRRARRASRRLHLAFWLGVLGVYLCYLLIVSPLFYIIGFAFVPITASNLTAHFFMPLFPSAIIACFIVHISGLFSAYNKKRRELARQSAGEQALALGADPARPDDDPSESRYVNLIAELSLATNLDEPDAYVLRADDSINAFALSGRDGSLALAVSRGALDNLTRDELQAVLAHEFGHIENGDPTLYNHLTAMIHGYYAASTENTGRFGSRLYTDPDTQALSLRSFIEDAYEREDSGYPTHRFSIVLYRYGRFMQAAFARQREEMADARAVQYTRDPAALISALQKAWALQTQGIHPRRPPHERAHIYFIDYRRPDDNPQLRTHPTLQERIRTWGGRISDADLPAILARIHACRSSRGAGLLRPAAPPPEPNPVYPLETYSLLCTARPYPAPEDHAAALLAYFAYHSGTPYIELERAGLLPSDRLAACRRAYDMLAQSEPLLRFALFNYISLGTLGLDNSKKRRLDPIIRRLIKHDGQLSRYELAAYIIWRAACIADGKNDGDDDYHAHEDDIAYLYNFLACDDPGELDPPQTTYRYLLASSALPLSQAPAWQPLDTDSTASGLQLCRHCDALYRLSPATRETLRKSIAEHYYDNKLQLTLKQAYLYRTLQLLLFF